MPPNVQRKDRIVISYEEWNRIQKVLRFVESLQFDSQFFRVNGSQVSLNRVWETDPSKEAFGLTWLAKNKIKIWWGYVDFHGRKSKLVATWTHTLAGSTPYIYVKYRLSNDTATFIELNEKVDIVQGQDVYLLCYEFSSPAPQVYRLVKDHRTGFNAVTPMLP